MIQKNPYQGKTFYLSNEIVFENDGGTRNRPFATVGHVTDNF